MPWNNSPLLKATEVAEFLWTQGINHVVYSPGSRNAPLNLAFSRFGKFRMYGVPDERSAGFVALGLRDSTQSPVGVITTSGSAVANLYPSVSEAFFREKELVLITADRPKAEAGNWTGQTIFQEGIFGKHIVKEIDLDLSDSIEEARGPLRDLGQIQGTKGPIHINIHFSEPFYPEPGFKGPSSNLSRVELKDDNPEQQELLPDLPTNSRIMMLFGQNEDQVIEENVLDSILGSGKVVMVRDICSNVPNLPGIISTYDLWKDLEKLPSPDLLISFGRSIVSKKFRNYLKTRIKKEIHIGSELVVGNPFDTDQQIFSTQNSKKIASWFEKVEGIEDYVNPWKKKEQGTFEHLKNEVLNTKEFSESELFLFIFKNLPKASVLNISNSLPIRYANFFQSFLQKGIKVFCNRGTSGIDGSMSTAIGAAFGNPNTQHFLVIGDQAFFYDVNALWQQNLPENLIIFLFNNGGGEIFETIHGPSAQPEFNDLFLFPTERNAEIICKDHSLAYQNVSNFKELKEIFGKIEKGIKGLNIFELQTNRTSNLESLNRISNL